MRASTFDLSEAIDVAATPGALRTVARQRALRTSQGDEVMLLATDRGGGALTLNMLLNLDALRIQHHMLLGYDNETCKHMASSIGRLAGATRRQSLLRMPCLRDTAWEEHVRSTHRRVAVTRRFGMWFARWSAIARLVRLGYNVLSCDVDAALLENPYPHLHAAELCGRFTLMFASDYDIGASELQNGFMYACGARRDGASAWVLAEAVDRYLRLADACGGAYDGEGANGGTDGTGGRGDEGTGCPAGSWLHAARAFAMLPFDQWLHRGAVHSAMAADGIHWWSVLEDTSSSAWPFVANRSVALEVLAAAREAPHGILAHQDGPPPPIRARWRRRAARGRRALPRREALLAEARPQRAAKLTDAAHVAKLADVEEGSRAMARMWKPTEAEGAEGVQRDGGDAEDAAELVEAVEAQTAAGQQRPLAHHFVGWTRANIVNQGGVGAEADSTSASARWPERFGLRRLSAKSKAANGQMASAPEPRTAGSTAEPRGSSRARVSSTSSGRRRVSSPGCAFWTTLTAAPPLARQLPPRAAAALDGSWQRACLVGDSGGGGAGASAVALEAAIAACRALGASCTALDAEARGLLPHRRGPLSRAWQTLLDDDLNAPGVGVMTRRGLAIGLAAGMAASVRRGARTTRRWPRGASERRPFEAAHDDVLLPSSTTNSTGTSHSTGTHSTARGASRRSPRWATDGTGGARWAAGAAGNEKLVLLPQWIVTHWTVAQRGLIGTSLPRTLIFHATNAADKELALKANGYWFPEAAHAYWSPPTEQQASNAPFRAVAALATIPGHQGQRVTSASDSTAPPPRVHDHMPSVDALISVGAARPAVVAFSAAALASLGTPTVDAYVAEVATPVLLAAHLTGRVAALPALPCASLGWGVPPWTPLATRVPPAPGNYTFGDCRTGACSY